MAALFYKKGETALFLSSASFIGRRQTHCSCRQFLCLKIETGMSCQKKLNVMKMCFWSKSETAFDLSQYMCPEGYTVFSFQQYWGYLSILGTDLPLLWPSAKYLYLLLCRCEHWPHQMGNFWLTSILHSQGTDINTYFKSGLLTSVEKAFLTLTYSKDKKILKYLRLDDAPSP